MKGIVFFKDGKFATAIAMNASEAKPFADAQGYTYKVLDKDDPDFLAALEYKPHAESRAVEYPSFGDQLDRITKALKYLSDHGVNIGPDGEAQVSACDAVKEKHPKKPFPVSEA